jgi:hypothetical protein
MESGKRTLEPKELLSFWETLTPSPREGDEEEIERNEDGPRGTAEMGRGSYHSET